MTEPVGGIDPHQDTFTVGIVDPHGVELVHETFDNTAAGYGAAIDLLDAHDVRRVGVEGSAVWGAHVAVALSAAGFDAREVPASRSAAQRRSRRLEKTDAVDAVASARALLAEPTLGPVQALEAYDPAVAEIEAVLEHRRTLVAARTLMLHHVADQITRAPHRDTRPAHHQRQDRESAAPPRRDRPRHRHDPSRPAPARMAASIHRPGPCRAQRDPPTGTPHRRAARPARHHLARRARHRPHRRRDAAVRGRRPSPVRPRIEVRPLVRHRRRRSLIGRGQQRPRQAPARLHRQPAHQLSAAHRVGHPAAHPARSHRLPRQKSQRRQDPTRPQTSPQTPTRQPRHPPNVARRNRPKATIRTRRLTRERRTDPMLIGFYGTGPRHTDAGNERARTGTMCLTTTLLTWRCLLFARSSAAVPRSRHASLLRGPRVVPCRLEDQG